MLSHQHIDETSGPSRQLGLANLLDAMLGNAPVGFALLDERLRFICLNQMFSEMTGFSPSQQLGQPLRALLPEMARRLEPQMQKVLESGASVSELEVEFKSASGLEPSRFAQMSMYPIPDLQGNICGVATIALDVTDRKIAEAKLKRASDALARSNLALEEFSYIASHDLKEPLRTITTFIQLLRVRYHSKLDKEADTYITHVVDGAKRMQGLIEQILEYSRSGKIDRPSATVNCNAIVQEIIDNLGVALKEANAKVVYDFLPIVPGDEILLYQVFQNLIANALKFRGPTPPEIRISAKREIGAWTFSVADNGIGIDSKQFANIFSPFKRLHSRSEFAGSGLGLAICRKNVERQGGKIWVSSVVGKGSVFSFTVPAVPTGETHQDEEHK
jgi:PAS domain S-box-containing protein